MRVPSFFAHHAVLYIALYITAAKGGTCAQAARSAASERTLCDLLPPRALRSLSTPRIVLLFIADHHATDMHCRHLPRVRKGRATPDVARNAAAVPAVSRSEDSLSEFTSDHSARGAERTVAPSPPTLWPRWRWDSHLCAVPRCARLCRMNKGLIWTIVGILLIVALVIWIMRAV